MCRNTPSSSKDMTATKPTAAPASGVGSITNKASPRKSSSSFVSGLVDAWNVVVEYYQAGQFSWLLIVYMFLVHTIAIIGLLTIPKCNPKTVLFALLLGPITGLGITVGNHRLWAHRTFEAHFIVRVVLMLLSSMANQRSINHWCKDHRVHHKYSETNADPHDATKGFFFAHIGWLLVRKHPDVGRLGKQMDFSDLLDDPVVRFQEFLDPWFAAYMCYIFPAQVASHFWNENFWYGFLVPGGFRYCIILHCTFLVNSAAHLFGDHPYDSKIHPAENPFVSIIANGEGWHNWHHKYPFDYAASEFGITSQYNPSKLIIDTLAAIGLVWGRKRATSHWAVALAKRQPARDNASIVTNNATAATAK